MSVPLQLLVGEDGQRLDQFLVLRLSDVSRAEVQRWIKQGLVRVDDRAAKPSTRLAAGQQVQLWRPKEEDFEVLPEAIPLDVVYEDWDLAVVNKAPGMVVHPAPGHLQSTLVSALMARYPDLMAAGGGERAGIVHRLDRDTSGLIVVARTADALAGLQAQFKARTVQKYYLALAEGLIESRDGRIEAPIGRDPAQRKRMAVLPEGRGGRPAATGFRVLGYFEPRSSAERLQFTLLELALHTGRTHQIRVHLAFIKHPVVGDRVYGRRRQRIRCPRQFLHAFRLVFSHPSTSAIIDVSAPLAPDLQTVLDSLISVDA